MATTPRTRRAAAIPEPAEAAPEAAPPRSHNLPNPGEMLDAEQWVLWLDHQFSGLTTRRTDLLESLARFKEKHPRIEDEHIQGRAGDLREKLAALKKLAEALHTTEKAPILTATKAIDGYKNGFLQDVQAGIEFIRAKQTEFANEVEAKRRREAQELAEQRRREANEQAALAARTMETADLEAAGRRAMDAERATKAAAAPAAELSRVHGQMGSATSLRTNWKFFPEKSSLADLAAAAVNDPALLRYLDFNAVNIGFAVRSEKVRDIPGCAIEEVRSV